MNRERRGKTEEEERVRQLPQVCSLEASGLVGCTSIKIDLQGYYLRRHTGAGIQTSKTHTRLIRDIPGDPD